MYDPNATAVEQNLLFGLLALQADLISRDDFLQACEQWSAGRELSFPRLLVQRGWLKAEDRREVERLVERKLARHGGDVRASLAELANNPLQGAFVSLQNRDVQLPLGMSSAGQPANNSVDGVAKVRRRDWGDHEDSHEAGSSGIYDHDPDSPGLGTRTYSRWLTSVAVIVVAILGAVALGLVLMPLAQQIQGGGPQNGGGIVPRGFGQVPPNQLPPGDPRTIQIYAEYFNNVSWFVVREPDKPEDAYRRALRLAEAAVKLAPEESHILNTLGVAQYRMGNYSEALKTLKESDRMNTRADRDDGPRLSIPADLAFLAMASFQLGEKEKAVAYLDRLRKAVLREPMGRADESEAFLREAEQLIEGAALPKAKTRPKEKPKATKEGLTA
jgi:hypothetical protein